MEGMPSTRTGDDGSGRRCGDGRADDVDGGGGGGGGGRSELQRLRRSNVELRCTVAGLGLQNIELRCAVAELQQQNAELRCTVAALGPIVDSFLTTFRRTPTVNAEG